MQKSFVLTRGAMLSLAWLSSSALAQQACVPNNGAVPPGSNTTDRSAPFFIDTTGLDLSTTPPTRDPANPDYVKATELPDGTLPPQGAEGNFIIGPTHKAAAETAAQDSVPHGKLYSLTISSADSIIFNPGVIRDDPPNCRNGSVNGAATAPLDGFIRAARALQDYDLRSVLPTLRCPAAFIAGAEDGMLPEVMRAMAGLCTGATFTAIPDAGHLPNVEQPVPFNAALSALLATP